MKFSLFYQLQNPRPWTERSEYERFWQCVEQAELAEQCGFHAVWIAEHHFMPEISHSGAPDIVLASIAQRTSTLRVGLGVVLLPIHHPLKVAERVATLDIMSNGRVEFGTGRSTTRTQLDAFGVDPAETRGRWEEGLELVLRLWAEEKVTFKGKYTQVDGLTVSPKPVQRPHPPIWVACGQPATYELAGKKGIGAMGFTSGNTDEWKRRAGLYHAALKLAKPASGVVNGQLGAWTIAHCAESDREARETAGPEGLWYFRLVRHQLDGEWNNAAAVPDSYKPYVAGGTRPFGGYDDYNAIIDRGMFIIGDPDSCIRQLERYEAAGIQHMLCVMQAGRVPHEKIKQSIRMFGKHIVPHFAKREARVG
ncbi:MAG: LLM class flavin-dependent oxidoreductase [Chloroflexi bacterium]|nr:LLM class flavin-dependent oxidoreductase [Chloroflexota bacterium]